MVDPDKKKLPANERFVMVGALLFRRPRMMGINDLRKGDDDKTMYAGGEKSGMAIEGADRPEHEAVRRIFEQAQKVDPESGEEETKPKMTAFQGRGQKLSGDDRPSTSAYPGVASREMSTERVSRTLTFWKNGFTISQDGPLYEYDNPENQKLLATLESGQVPLQLFNVLPGQQVDVRVDHKMLEDFVPSRPAMQAFSGKGQRLGDFAEPAKATTSTSQPTTSLMNLPTVDDSKPKTTLQIRLADGNKINVTLNTTVSVAELYSSIQSNSNRPFILLSGRPPVKLSHDDTRSLKDAQLQNTVIIQQWEG